jgi:predicted RNA-binding protein
VVETRAKGHAEMTSALKSLSKYSKYLEEGSPGFKGKGVFYYDYHSLSKPEVIRYQRKLVENYRIPANKDSRVILTTPNRKPYSRSQGFKKLKKQTKEYNEHIDYCFIAAPYGLIPENLAETYPTSQYQIAEPFDYETIQHTVGNIIEYLEKHPAKTIIVYRDVPLDQELIKQLNGKYPSILINEIDNEATEAILKQLATI